MAEANLFGVYFSGALVSAVLAVIALLILRRILGLIGFYRHAWHPNLVDVALFVVLWGLSTWVLNAFSGGFA